MMTKHPIRREQEQAYAVGFVCGVLTCSIIVVVALAIK